MFDPERTLAVGVILFSHYSADWQTHLYQNNPLLSPKPVHTSITVQMGPLWL